jgi:hypothetical protein
VHKCRAILHFPKNCWGGHDLLWRWSVHGVFPIQCGPHFISGRGLGEICSQKVTCGHVSGHLGRVPQAPGRIPPFSLVGSSGQEYIVLPLPPPGPYRRTRIKRSRMEHTHVRALSPPGPPWPTRVCSQPIRDGRGGFAATLARCAQLASGRHVTPAPPCLGPEPGWRARREGPRAVLSLLSLLSLFRSSAFPSLPPAAAPGPRPANWAGRPPFAAAPPARESAALAGGASSGAAEPTAAPSRGPCSGPRRHARTPRAHRLPCSPLRLSGRLPGRARFASTQTLRPPSGARMSCNPSLSQKPPGGTRFTMAVVRATSFPHTMWAAFYLRTGTW